MSDTPPSAPPGGPQSGPQNGPDAAGQDAPRVQIVAQYIRDLSFENIAAQKGGLGKVQPNISVNVSTDLRPAGGDRHEVALKIAAEAKAGEAVIFLVELDYGAVVEIRNVDDKMRVAVLMVEIPRLIFPFARRIVADTTRDGGFPPLMLDPVDFAALYRQEAERRAAAQGVAEA